MKAVFLDRDGVLNEAIVRDGRPYSPGTLDEVIIPPRAGAALAALRRRGYRLIMVTNQPDIARKKISREAVQTINRHVCEVLSIDAVEMCAHDDGDDCDCRKPRPGMLIRAAQRDGIDLAASFMVGDRGRDIEAGRRATCRTILIGKGYDEIVRPQPDVAVGSVVEAAVWILAQKD
jgi:D-glycero-D-manno-heptose 1,7-bisphosphate phosphatase